MSTENERNAESIHVIRLRGPWQCEASTRSGAAEGTLAAQQIQLPADIRAIIGADFGGVVRLLRRFHQPSGLDAKSRVYLLVNAANAEVILNDSNLGQLRGSHRSPLPGELSGPARFDITNLLRPNNLLAITVTRAIQKHTEKSVWEAESTETAGEWIGPVWLEIETLSNTPGPKNA